MFRFIRTATICLAVGILGATVFSQSRSTGEIKRTDVLVKTIERYTRENREKIVVADVSDFDKGTPEWKLFGSEQALDKYREGSETYTIALNWQRNGKIVASNFTLFSPSGDWSKFVFHYFRPDGSLALARSELRTFEGEYTVKEDRYFDSRGRLLKKTIQYFDLATGKPKKPTKELRDDNPSLYKVDYFLNVNKLPFAKLISQKR